MRTLLLPVALVCVAAQTNITCAQSLSVTESPTTIAIHAGDRSVLVYNKVSPPVPKGIDPVYRRSGCLHPVSTPTGSSVTAMFPADHPHQHGVFSAWVRTTYRGRKVDFWNLAGETGRVRHGRVVGLFKTESGTGFEVDLVHCALLDEPVDVLRERWKVTAFPTDGSYRCFDLETTQTALTDTPLTVNKYHYGGIAIRGPTAWVTGNASGEPREPSRFLNSRGSDRVKGNHEPVRWVALTGNINGRPATVAVLSHTDNFRSPQPARLHPSKPYFCFAPCVTEAFTIDRQHPYRARYRYLVTDAAPDAAWIDKQWSQWANDP